MFFQLLFIHLYRPFLKYTRSTSPLPSHASPRKFCTQAAGAISKLFRLYKRTYGLRQICNIAVYIIHSACTIHLLNLPDENAKRDIVHGVKHLEEIGESWTCARRTLRVLSISAEKWKLEVPEDATVTFARCNARWENSELSRSPTGFSNILPQSSPTKPPTSQTYPPPSTPISANNPGGVSMAQHLPSVLGTGLVPSPSSTTSDTRRSSGGLSLPPQSASDLTRGAGRIRPLTYLTQAQQDAWNASQVARSISAANSGPTAGANTNASAAALFGGVDSLVEESQDWWLKDQSALALGFDNWIDAGTGWSTLGLGMTEALQNGANGDAAPKMMKTGNMFNASFMEGLQSGGYTLYSATLPLVNGMSGKRPGNDEDFGDETFY
jgi:hypothetical protein